jgi:hypothetical protein
MAYIIEMESAEYGIKSFEYPNRRLAREGLKRLKAKAIEQTKIDGIKRTVRLYE